MQTKTNTTDVSSVEDNIRSVADTYRRVRGIYQRTEAALGRIPRYRVTIASTSTVIGRNAKHVTS